MFKKIMDNLSNKITPEQKRILVIILTIVGVGFMAYTYISSSPHKVRKKKAKPIKEVFMHEELGDKFGIQGLAYEIKVLKKENKELKRKLEQLKTDKTFKDIENQINPEKIEEKVTQRALDLLRQRYEKRIQKLETKYQELENSKKQPANATLSGSITAENPANTSSDSFTWDDACPLGVFCSDSENSSTISPYDIDWESASSNSNNFQNYGTSQQKGKKGKKTNTTSSSLKTIKGKKKTAQLTEEERAKRSGETFIPAGSIFSGTLITGLDAPTSDAVKKDPFPVLLRIKKEAILPNRYRADVRECFLIASGWGDLSSERAYVRSERLSCVREDGNVIETNIDMYAVGEDGKAGIRGRLVSKQGQVIARALMAGFMEGFANMFTKVPVPQLNTSPGTTALYQQQFSQEALESASLQGVGNAFKKIADYYIQMAKNIFPVIEIDAGRAIDFVAVRGIKIKLGS